jgi:hypothetical protein
VLPLLFWTACRWYDQPEVSLASLVRLYSPMLVWAVPVYLVFCGIWIYLIKRGMFRARFSFYGLLMIELMYELFSGVADRNFGRIGLGLLFLGFIVVIYRWLEGRIESAQINPKIEWYEGEPKTLPHLKARVRIEEEWFEAQVRLLDRKGVFLFLKGWNREKRLKAKMPLSFELSFRNQTVEGDGRITSWFENEYDQVCHSPGIGLQFLPKDLYHFSQYTALVESLKGEGYV